VIRGRLDERVVDRIVAETRGNPLALLELPHAHAARELAGGFAVSPHLPITTRVEQSFLRRLHDLPGPTQQLVLLAAAEPVGDPALLLRAAEQRGIGVAAAARGDCRVARTRHSCALSSSLGAVGDLRGRHAKGSQAAHGALAEATDPEADPDRRPGTGSGRPRADEDVAVELERSARRAQARGGIAAAAAFLDRGDYVDA